MERKFFSLHMKIKAFKTNELSLPLIPAQKGLLKPRALYLLVVFCLEQQAYRIVGCAY